MKKLGFNNSFLIFGGFALILYLETHLIIPWFSNMTGIETILSWFLVGGFGIFIPMVVFAFILLKKENLSLNKETWTTRLRFKSLTHVDWIWSILGLITIGIFTQLIIMILESILGKAAMHLTFMTFESLSDDRYWILLVWLPFWIFNIMGEEFLWRGVLLPRQEISFGKWTWFYHGLFWSLFHIAFGWQLYLILIPIIFIQPYLVQKRKNSWIGVIIHAGLNGPGFIAVVFGIV